MNIRPLTTTAALAATLLLAACATRTGLGTASSRSGNLHANFEWTETDDHTGTMNATFASGESYSGRFFQITRDTRVDSLAPLWAGWHPGFGGWRYWDPGAQDAFVTEYSGRVVANQPQPKRTERENHKIGEEQRAAIIRGELGWLGSGVDDSGFRALAKSERSRSLRPGCVVVVGATPAGAWRKSVGEISPSGAPLEQIGCSAAQRGLPKSQPHARCHKKPALYDRCIAHATSTCRERETYTLTRSGGMIPKSAGTSTLRFCPPAHEIPNRPLSHRPG